MKSFKLTDGDIDLTNGATSFVEGDEYVKQKIETRLRMFQGEWFLDTRLGFPWFQEVLGKKTITGKVDNLFRQALITIPEVASVTQLSSEYDSITRTYSVEYTVRTGEGEIISGGVPFVLPG